MTKLLRNINLAILAVIIPCLHGCGGGGGVGELANFLFGSGNGVLGSGSGSLPPGIAGTIPGNLPTMSNPEPSSMLLIGAGMAAMTYYKARNNKNAKK